MNGRSFQNLSPDECRSVYKLILENSKGKWESAEKLAGLNDFGTAISLMVISIEELAKAIVIFYDGHGFRLRQVDGIQTFFKNHRIRHVISYWLFLGMLIGDEIKNLVQGYRDKPNQLFLDMNALFDDGENAIQKIVRHLKRKLVVLRQELNWFSRLEDYRQNGFYTDFKGEPISPVKTDKFFYDEVHERLIKVKDLGMFILETADQQWHQDLLTKMTVEFEKQGVYDKLQFALEKVRKTKINPLILVGQDFKIKK